MKLRRLHDAIGIPVFLIVVGVFFLPTLLGGKLPVPSDALVGLYHPWRDRYSKEYPHGIPFKNFLITDPVRQQIPWRRIAIDQWKQGSVPLWNPYNFSGAPLRANIQAAVFYPFNVLFFLLSFPDAWAALVVLQPALGGLFLYWYLRSLSLRVEASFLGAIAWSFSGFNVAWLTWGTIGHVALWLPLSLLAIDRRWSFLLALSVVMQFFAGHAQISLYFLLMVIAYAIARKRFGFRFLFLLGLAGVLASVQWVPLLALVGESGRLAVQDWHSEGWFLPWQHLVQFVAPDFFGNPATLNYWGQWNYGELIGYVGILPLIFAALGATVRNRERMFWTLAAVVGFLFALPTPIASLPFLLKLPLLSSLQPTRLMFVIDFALAMLAAYGFHRMLEERKFRWHAAVIAAGFALAALWFIALAWRLDVSVRNLVIPTALYLSAVALLFAHTGAFQLSLFRNVGTWSMVGLTAVDLLRFGWKFTPFTPREYFFPETKIISFLKQQPKPFRMVSLDKRLFPPNTASYYGIEMIEGYDPLISSRYEELAAAIARRSPDIMPPFGFHRIVTLEAIDSPLFPLLGVRYVLSLNDLHEPYLKEVLRDGETRVYEDTRALPRIYPVEQVVLASEKKRAIEALYGLDHLARQAVVEADVSIVPAPLEKGESIVLRRYESNRIEIETHLAVRRLIVIANSYHPGWRATIDGEQTAIYRTNYAFQGIIVPHGIHTVVLSFLL